MSEDTAHGQHYEPGNGAASPAQAQQAGAVGDYQGVLDALEQVLDAQVERVQKLAVRVGTLISTTEGAFQEFILETGVLFMALRDMANGAKENEANANRPTDRPTTQASA